MSRNFSIITIGTGKAAACAINFFNLGGAHGHSVPTSPANFSDEAKKNFLTFYRNNVGDDVNPLKMNIICFTNNAQTKIREYLREIGFVTHTPEMGHYVQLHTMTPDKWVPWLFPDSIPSATLEKVG